MYSGAAAYQAHHPGGVNEIMGGAAMSNTQEKKVGAGCTPCCTYI